MIQCPASLFSSTFSQPSSLFPYWSPQRNAVYSSALFPKHYLQSLIYMLPRKMSTRKSEISPFFFCPAPLKCITALFIRPYKHACGGIFFLKSGRKTPSIGGRRNISKCVCRRWASQDVTIRYPQTGENRPANRSELIGYP